MRQNMFRIREGRERIHVFLSEDSTLVFRTWLYAKLIHCFECQAVIVQQEDIFSITSLDSIAQLGKALTYTKLYCWP